MVFDCFTYFQERDLLRLRLEILSPYVDKFILVESRQTFMGEAKFLDYFLLSNQEEWIRPYLHKIIHVIAPDIEIKKVPFERHWLCYALEEALVKEIADPEDIIFFSDLDEIWNPEILSKVDDNPHSLEQLNYTYYLNMRSNEEWTGTLMTKVKNVDIGFNKLNRTAKPYPLPNGGWHFTNMGGKEQVIKKILAYDHGHEINPKWVEEHIEENMENGGDYLGRYSNYQGEPYKFWLEEKNWPEYLRENRQKYIGMLK